MASRRLEQAPAELASSRLAGLVRHTSQMAARGSWVAMADPEGNEFCVLSARD